MNITLLIGLSALIIMFISSTIEANIPGFNIKIVPIQNFIIGLVATLIDYIITNDFSLALSLLGATVTGIYVIVHNFKDLDWIDITRRYR